MVVTDDQVRDFRDKGFIVLKGFFDQGVMDKVSAFLDDLRNKPPAEGPAESEEAKYYEESPSTGEKILVRVENMLGDNNPELTRLLISPEVTETLTRLFGEAPVLFKDKANYKLPGCRPDKLHQDQAAGWNAYCDLFITMGLIVDPNRKTNGALSFLKSGNYEKALMSEEWKPLTEDDPPYSPEEEYMLLEADPGDVIFFDSYVPHGSPSNDSNTSRRNVYITFNRQSDGDMRMQYYRDKWRNYAPNKADDARTDESFRV
ncbi:MAG: phytanoyl-CoA dioxygenase family protein [Rhodospirillales bacterium]|nr:phytanoyl-CoA dioxygenase family protein [Alphaproteobacteria bacterium]MBL6948779.1 phytanoyl-CoA dioxygenase family protein [Rhodospirillales bacterium]